MFITLLSITSILTHQPTVLWGQNLSHVTIHFFPKLPDIPDENINNVTCQINGRFCAQLYINFNNWEIQHSTLCFYDDFAPSQLLKTTSKGEVEEYLPRNTTFLLERMPRRHIKHGLYFKLILAKTIRQKEYVVWPRLIDTFSQNQSLDNLINILPDWAMTEKTKTGKIGNEDFFEKFEEIIITDDDFFDDGPSVQLSIRHEQPLILFFKSPWCMECGPWDPGFGNGARQVETRVKLQFKAFIKEHCSSRQKRNMNDRFSCFNPRLNQTVHYRRNLPIYRVVDAHDTGRRIFLYFESSVECDALNCRKPYIFYPYVGEFWRRNFRKISGSDKPGDFVNSGIELGKYPFYRQIHNLERNSDNIPFFNYISFFNQKNIETDSYLDRPNTFVMNIDEVKLSIRHLEEKFNLTDDNLDSSVLLLSTVLVNLYEHFKLISHNFLMDPYVTEFIIIDNNTSIDDLIYQYNNRSIQDIWDEGYIEILGESKTRIIEDGENKDFPLKLPEFLCDDDVLISHLLKSLYFIDFTFQIHFFFAKLDTSIDNWERVYHSRNSLHINAQEGIGNGRFWHELIYPPTGIFISDWMLTMSQRVSHLLTNLTMINAMSTRSFKEPRHEILDEIRMKSPSLSTPFEMIYFDYKSDLYFDILDIPVVYIFIDSTKFAEDKILEILINVHQTSSLYFGENTLLILAPVNTKLNLSIETGKYFLSEKRATYISDNALNDISRRMEGYDDIRMNFNYLFERVFGWSISDLSDSVDFLVSISTSIRLTGRDCAVFSDLSGSRNLQNFFKNTKDYFVPKYEWLDHDRLTESSRKFKINVFDYLNFINADLFSKNYNILKSKSTRFYQSEITYPIVIHFTFDKLNEGEHYGNDFKFLENLFPKNIIELDIISTCFNKIQFYHLDLTTNYFPFFTLNEKMDPSGMYLFIIFAPDDYYVDTSVSVADSLSMLRQMSDIFHKNGVEVDDGLLQCVLDRKVKLSENRKRSDEL